MPVDDKIPLVPAEALKQLGHKSDFKGLLQLFAHVCLVLLTGIVVAMSQQSGLLIPAMLIHGIVLIFVFAPLHETIHYTAFRSRWINNSVAAVFGFILFLPFQYFRAYHYVHHRHTQDQQKDPELIDKTSFSRASFLCYMTGLPTWRWHLSMLWQHAMGDISEPYLEPRVHARIINEARIHLALYLLILLSSLINANSWIVYYWIVPIVLGQPFLRLFLMAEHSGCDLSDDMLKNSRTTYTSPLVNFLAWNMPYHAEHHYLASIPFHALPALHAYTGQSVKYRGNSFWKILREIGAKISTG